MEAAIENEIQVLYHRLIAAWNDRSARGMADLFMEDGEIVGFDGSESRDREEIYSHLAPIFEHHPTPPYVSKVKEVRLLGSTVAMVRAIAGMVPPGKTEINPSLNAHQTLIAVNDGGVWKIQLFQTTPAQYHGRPELVEAMTAELKELLGRG